MPPPPDPNIAERVDALMREVFELSPGALRPDATLYDELGLDSLDSVDLVVALEKEFGFKIAREADETRIRELRTLSDVCGFVRTKLDESAAGS